MSQFKSEWNNKGEKRKHPAYRKCQENSYRNDLLVRIQYAYLNESVGGMVNTAVKEQMFPKLALVREMVYRPHLGCGVGQPCEVSNTSKRTI